MNPVRFRNPGRRLEWLPQPQFFLKFCLSLFILTGILHIHASLSRKWDVPAHVQAHRKQALGKCKYLRTPAGPPPDFASRSESDRFVAGTKPVLLKNAKVWTGARNGTEVVYGDVLLDRGLIKAVGYIPPELLMGRELQVQDARGAWVTPGLVDLHSHIGVGSSPHLRGEFRFFASQ